MVLTWDSQESLALLASIPLLNGNSWISEARSDIIKEFLEIKQSYYLSFAKAHYPWLFNLK
jgi:hypothetical protein